MKKNPISHYYRVRNFSILTFLKRGNFTLVKILFKPFPDATTAPASIHVCFFYFELDCRTVDRILICKFGLFGEDLTNKGIHNGVRILVFLP